MRFSDRWPGDEPASDATAVGIVVQDGVMGDSRPHVAFVWGPPEVKMPPSLPFGRWKPARAA